MMSHPSAQRDLRVHRATRPSLRVASGPEHLARLVGRLQPRDRWLARMLFEHHVFTSHQICQLAFAHHRVANRRLHQLYTLRVVDRFQPFTRTGSAPMHYVLDTAGALLLAHEDGLDPKTLGYRHDKEIGRALSLQLAHDVGANGLFTALIAHSRTHPGTGELTAWWSATRCARHFGDIVRPDAYGRWAEAGRQIDWFLEFDAGTEQHSRLAGKLARYHRLAATTGITTPVLIWLPTPRREHHARPALTRALRGLDRVGLVPVATSHGDLTTHPDAAWWLPLDTPSTPRRCRLIDLTHAWPALTTTPADPDTGPAAAEGQPRPPAPMPPETTTGSARGS